jgi:hypothetical protein
MLFNRRPRALEIFVRHCNYSSVSAHKKRFASFNRKSCLDNLLSTLEGYRAVNVTFLLDTFHPMRGTHFLYKQTRYPVVECKAGSETASFLFMLDYVMGKKLKEGTIVYFLEDDYLHLPNWVSILREAFTLPGIDYVTLYDHKDKYFFPQYQQLTSRLFHTTSCHWRTTPSTTNTYAMLFGTLEKHLSFHREFSLNRAITADHDKFSALGAQGAVLISSIPGFSTHAEPAYASPCTDWERVYTQTISKVGFPQGVALNLVP